MKSFKDVSYEKHSEFYKYLRTDKQLEKHKTFFQVKTVDLWRHIRQFELIDIFCGLYKNSEWLTVGDGGFGTSATYIEMKGGKAMSTDLDVSFLKLALENNLISKYEFANAENLPFKEEHFDFSFCKQSYHHFPRPYVAVYEMLRVSKKAVLFVEPSDWLPSPSIVSMLQYVKRKIKSLMGKRNPHHDEGSFETYGNYIYTISEREIEKIGLGIGLPCVAFKRFHDIYIEGVEVEMIEKKGPLQKKINERLLRNDLLTRLGLSNKNNIMCILFKYLPEVHEQKILKNHGFEVVILPKNPYTQ